MAKLLLDNLMKVFKQQLTYNGVTQASVELDLDIPRGYVIRIHDLTLILKDVAEDIEGISVDKLIRYVGALVKDPDDTTSTLITLGRVDHDVLADFSVNLIIVAGTAGDTVAMFDGPTFREFNFSAEGLDVITARNLRLNVDAAGTNGADATEASLAAVIRYTLEKITDQDILALLDII